MTCRHTTNLPTNFLVTYVTPLIYKHGKSTFQNSDSKSERYSKRGGRGHPKTFMRQKKNSISPEDTVGVRSLTIKTLRWKLNQVGSKLFHKNSESSVLTKNVILKRNFKDSINYRKTIKKRKLPCSLFLSSLFSGETTEKVFGLCRT